MREQTHSVFPLPYALAIDRCAAAMLAVHLHVEGLLGRPMTRDEADALRRVVNGYGETRLDVAEVRA